MSSKINAIPEAKEVTSEALVVEPVNAVLERGRSIAQPRPLCGSLWQEGEILLLFGDGGVGKTFFALALCEALAEGTAFLDLETPGVPMPVIYFDFEMSDKAWARRFGSREVANNFLRGAIQWAKLEDGEDMVKLMKEKVEATGSEVVVVDNVSTLESDTNDGKVMTRLMRSLIQFRDELGVSLLVLAHTKKVADPKTELTADLLTGSKRQQNFADSVVGMRTSRVSSRPEPVYLKHCKARNVEIEFGGDRVIDFVKVDTTDGRGVQLRPFTDGYTMSEKEHLSSDSGEVVSDKTRLVIEEFEKQSERGVLSYSAIAKVLQARGYRITDKTVKEHLVKYFGSEGEVKEEVERKKKNLSLFSQGSISTPNSEPQRKEL